MNNLKKVSSETKRLEAVITTATDGIIVIDDRGIVESMNPAAANLFMYKAEEVIGQNIKMLMPQPFRREHDGYLHSYHKTGVAKIIGIGREVKGQKSDGSIFPLRLAISEMNIDGNKMYTGIIHDLTDLKIAEQNIVNLNKKLEEKVANRTEELAVAINRLLSTNNQLQIEIKEREAIEKQLREHETNLKQALNKEKELHSLKTRFVSMASHEFRTPLSTILTSAELVEMYANTTQQPKRMRHIDRIRSAVSNLTDVLDDFLSLSRLDEGKLEADCAAFPIGEFLEQVAEDINVLLKPGQKLQIKNTAENTSIFSDAKFLKNILINLLSNASKYSDKNKEIFLAVALQHGQLYLEVRDEGLGIPEEDQKHLFTRFFRAHNVDNIKGTGLGLHIVKRYVDMLHGEINFKSELGKGSVFTILLPNCSLENQSNE